MGAASAWLRSKCERSYTRGPTVSSNFAKNERLSQHNKNILHNDKNLQDNVSLRRYLKEPTASKQIRIASKG